MIQGKDGLYYGGFAHQYEGINIKEDVVYTLYGKKETEDKLRVEGWYCKLSSKQSKSAVQIVVGGVQVVRNAHPWAVEWVDWIPTPMYFKARTGTPTGDFKVFVINPTQEEVEGVAKGVYSERIKVAMGGTHLSPLALKRRLKKSTLDGVIYAYG